MILFTKHAVDRYIEFHLIARITRETEISARETLEAMAVDARKSGRTFRGDPIWSIDSLGIELVCKHEGHLVTCVTILPPVRFRGLTPLQAELVAERAAEAETRREALEVEVARIAVEADAAAQQAKATKSANRAAERELQATLNAGKTARVELVAQYTEVRSAAKAALAERDLYLGVLKTMRAQLHVDEQTRRMKSALRAALVYVRQRHRAGCSDAGYVMDAVREIDAGLASDAFVLHQVDSEPLNE